MKTIKCIFVSILMTISFSSSAQSFENFIKYEGIKTLASLAHPSNTYLKSYYTIYSDAVVFDIYYSGGIRTKVQMNLKNGWFTSVKVIYDNDWFPPFLGVELIKDFLYEVAREMDSTQASNIQSAYEKWLNKQIYQFTGKDITMVVMTLSWAGY